MDFARLLKWLTRMAEGCQARAVDVTFTDSERLGAQLRRHVFKMEIPSAADAATAIGEAGAKGLE